MTNNQAFTGDKYTNIVSLEYKSRLAVSLIFFVCGFVYSNWSTRLPNIQQLFSLDNSTLGLILLCVALGSLTSMPLTGWLIARQGSRLSTMLSALLFASVLFLFPFLTSKWQLATFFYVVGMFTGALDVAMNAQAVSVEKKFSKPMMSSFHAIFSIGMMLGALSGSFFIQFSINTHFLLVSAGCLALILCCLPFLITDPERPHQEGGLKFMIPNQAMLILGVIAFCAMLGEGAMADWSTNYLKNVLNTNDTIAPLGLSAFSAAMTIGRLGGDKLRERWSDPQLIFANSLLATIGLILTLLLPSVWIVIVGMFLVGAGLSTIIPIIYSTAGHDQALPNGVGLAIVSTLGYSGMLFGPPIIGFLADIQGLRNALYFIVVLFALMLFLSRRIPK